MGAECESAAERRAQVLVVEDDPGSRATLVYLLESEGYRVASAGNGQEALEYLRREPLPAVILLDVALPVMDGMEFRRRQLQDPRLAAIPVVVMTGAGDSAEAAFSIAGAGYFIKPYSINELLATIARHCRPDAPGAPDPVEPEEGRESP